MALGCGAVLASVRVRALASTGWLATWTGRVGTAADKTAEDPHRDGWLLREPEFLVVLSVSSAEDAHSREFA